METKLWFDSIIDEIKRMHVVIDKLVNATNALPLDLEKYKADLVEKITTTEKELTEKITDAVLDISKEISALKVKSGVWGGVGAATVILITYLFKKI